MTTSRVLVLAALATLCSVPATAQPDPIAVITQAKADLHAAGVVTEGPGDIGKCGAFQIVNLAASRIPGAQLLQKHAPQNHCEWPAGSGDLYGVDVIVLNNQIWDALANAENINDPAWQLDGPMGPNDVARPPVGGSVPQTPAPPPVVVTSKGEKGEKGDKGDQGPPGAASDTAALTARVAQLEGQLRNLTCKASINLLFARADTSCTIVQPK